MDPSSVEGSVSDSRSESKSSYEREDRPDTREYKIFVGGLKLETTEDDLKDYFEQFGEIEKSIVKYNNDTKISRGFGFISFKEERSRKKVLEIEDHCIMNKKIDCKTAMTKEEAVKKNQAQITQRRKIYVKNIPQNQKKKDLKVFFSEFGTVEEVNLIYKNKEAKGFAFIVFRVEEEASRVLEKEELIFNGETLVLKLAIPKDKMGSLSNSNNGNKIPPIPILYGNKHYPRERGHEVPHWKQTNNHRVFKPEYHLQNTPVTKYSQDCNSKYYEPYQSRNRYNQGSLSHRAVYYHQDEVIQSINEQISPYGFNAKKREAKTHYQPMKKGYVECPTCSTIFPLPSYYIGSQIQPMYGYNNPSLSSREHYTQKNNLYPVAGYHQRVAPHKMLYNQYHPLSSNNVEGKHQGQSEFSRGGGKWRRKKKKKLKGINKKRAKRNSHNSSFGEESSKRRVQKDPSKHYKIKNN